MTDLFTLDPATLATVENGIDSLIHQLGKQCKLIYASDKQVCPNCIFDPITHRSTNKYNGVGPKAFSKGKCPVCKGTGYLPDSGVTEDTVQLLVDWQPKPWQFLDPTNADVPKLPQGAAMTKGFAADMPRIMQAKYIIIDYANAIYESNRFVRFSEPVLQGNIVKSKYFVCYWKRFEA